MKQILAFLIACCCSVGALAAKKQEPVVVAYVTSWTRVMPDPSVMTHINYAFGHVSEQFDGVRIDNEERLRSIVALKKQQPRLRVMLSIGGWGSGRFSEMAASETLRTAFCNDCRRLCDELGLDGIDIDWEYPTQSSAGISSSPQDTENFTLLMRDLRKALGKKRWLTLASVGNARYIDFRSCQQYLDLVNVMAYDMANAPKHHAALFRSPNAGWCTSSEAVEAHRKAGVPDEKLVLGMPFYGRGKVGKYMKYKDRAAQTLEERWDAVARASYLVDEQGTLAIGYDNPRALAVKCAYIKQQGLRGAMYWEYADDTEQGDLARAVWQGIMQGDRQRSTSCRRAAQRLAAVLKANQRREDVSPDSFFHDYRDLMSHIKREKDPTVQAIYRAATAHLLCLNQWRSQGFGRTSTSHPDSIQEWSRQEYNAQAALLYAQALQDVEALHVVRLADVKPLTELGRDDDVFGDDLLYLIWQSARQDIDYHERQKGLIPGYADLIELYQKHGLREATLQLRLDSLADKEGAWKEDDLLRLKEEYADLDACAQVYLRLAMLPDKTPAEQQDILMAGLKRYPKSRQAAELQNQIASLRQPMLSARFCEMFYPDKDYDIPLQIKNMQTGSLTLYRVPTGFAFSDDEKDGTQIEQLRRVGTVVETLAVPMQGVTALETKHDTLHWHTPGFGRYAVVLDGTSAEKTGSVEPQIAQFSVSALAFMHVNLPDGTKRIMVTDAMTGQPQQGVSVRFYQREQHNDTLKKELQTDSRGIVELPFEKRNTWFVELSRGDDQSFGRQSITHYYYKEAEEKPYTQLRIYSDRSIYRPGQTVYVGGIAYTRSHDLAPEAAAGVEYQLILTDANGQEVAKHTLKTDDFGTLQDSIQLPESGLPGRYNLRVGNTWHDFRVEEYRRPTFEVRMDEAPAVTLPVDSITLTGRALTYSQWPVAGARVTGTYQWQQSWWYKRFAPTERHDIDTLYTDEEGRFSITVPVPKEDLRWGQTLQLHIDVLSAEGETQQGSARVPLCSTPLRMNGSVPEQQCRENLSPWRFDLYASNDKTVAADVLCMLTQDDKEVKNFYLPSGKDTIPELLRNLPSGKYELKAKADVKGDTASFKANFTVFSITDKRLQGKHDLWLYAPSDVMSAEKPARFQMGTTLRDAWIYCIIKGENGIVRDTILHLSDEATLFEIPYEERFRHRIGVTLMMRSNGRLLQETKNFSLEQPDTQLRMRWDTFRDHLQPGQKEQWRLTLTRPDGKPAAANVMVGMYDASLDALASYKMTLGVDRACHRNVLNYAIGSRQFERFSYLELGLPLQFQPVEGYDFARWNESLFMGMPMVSRATGRMMKTRSLGADGLAEVAVYNTMAAPMAKVAADEESLHGQIAGLDVVETADALGDNAMRLRGDADAEDDAAAEAMGDVSVRSNLSELAFFYPRLRTDSRGQTSIEFSLPEALTSWHLHGLAHTTDMLTAQWQETIVARKELMAELTLPRFLRNGDEVLLTASVRNASTRRQKGDAVLEVQDAETGKVLKRTKVGFDLEPGKESVHEVPFKASMEHPLLVVQWKAKGEESSDGESRCLPVLSDMQNVAETRTYLLRGDTTLTMDLSTLFADGNAAATGKRLTVEHVSEPIYLALQALPSLTAPVRNDILSVAAAYYGGSVASHVAHKYPKIRAAIESFRPTSADAAALSPLERNQQLADILLNETPWVVDAQRQKQSRQRLASLFDEMEQDDRRMTMLSALSARQHADGSFGWFPGMKGSRWMTSEVAMLMVRLGAIKDGWTVPERQILDRAMSFLTKEMHEEVVLMQKEKKPMLSFGQLRYLYIYIMYSKTLDDDASFLLSLLKKQAEDYDREERALASIVLKRAGEDRKAQALMPRLHTLLGHTDGKYLAYPGGSFTSIDRKVQTHVCLMEAVQTVEPEQTDLLGEMAEWLIRQKRTQEWEQPVQSADAVYALMQTPQPSSGGVWSGAVAYDNKTLPLKSEGPYTRKSIEPIGKAKTLRIEQKVLPQGQGGEGAGRLSWGSVVSQYQIPAQQAESHREGMTIRREVDVKANDQKPMANGKYTVRYTITADRDYEYVSLRCPRPASAEPASQLSGYRWQGGLGYYQAIHDASTEYYMDSLPRGTYVIEEEWYVGRQGSFLLPPARLTCLYAPEFQSQTAGQRLGSR